MIIKVDLHSRDPASRPVSSQFQAFPVSALNKTDLHVEESHSSVPLQHHLSSNTHEKV